MIKKIIQFLSLDIWRISYNKLPKYQQYLVRMVRTLILAFKGYNEDKISLRSSALTFYSMLSVVPVAAMAFGISKMVGIDKHLTNYLNQQFAGQKEVLDWIIKFAHSFLENTKGGLIAGIGAIILLWSVLQVFANIERSFNAIWQVRKGRNWFRKFSDYMSLLIVAPILLVSSSSATVFISTSLERMASEITIIGMISPILFFFVKLIPYVLIWFLLTIIFMVMPNTKVNFKSAFIAGIVAGTAFVFIQWAYIHFQVGMSKYNAIYGSFAALPLFLIWLQISWLIVLFGAELSFAVQNVEKHELEPDTQNLNNYSWRILSLSIAQLCIKNFKEGEIAYTSSEISSSLQIPIRLVHDIIYKLVDCRILSEVNTSHAKEMAYQPAQDISKLSISYVLEALDHLGNDRILEIASDESKNIKQIIDKLNAELKDSEGKKLLSEIG